MFARMPRILGLVGVLVLAAMMPASASVARGASAPAIQSSQEACGKRLPIVRNGATLYLPYCANLSPDAQSSAIKRVLVVIHGGDRLPEYTYDVTLDIASASQEAETLFLVPAFFNLSDLQDRSLAPDTLYWSSSGWKEGNKSLDDPPAVRPFRVSSFEALDELIKRFGSRVRFPNLQEIVIAGHSSGGQYVQRFAAIGKAETNSGSQGPRFRYVVANPSSYVYVNSARYYRTSTGSIGFRSLSTTARNQCPGYNDYKYGLNALNSYGSSVGTSAIRSQYGKRTVTYLAGANDTDVNDPSLDTSCEAVLQGTHRRDRAEIYAKYVGYYYGSGVYARHTLKIVPSVGHSTRGMLSSPEGRAALFGTP